MGKMVRQTAFFFQLDFGALRIKRLSVLKMNCNDLTLLQLYARMCTNLSLEKCSIIISICQDGWT